MKQVFLPTASDSDTLYDVYAKVICLQLKPGLRLGKWMPACTVGFSRNWFG